MHFSIPETVELRDSKGSAYTVSEAYICGHVCRVIQKSGYKRRVGAVFHADGTERGEHKKVFPCYNYFGSANIV